MIARPGDLVQRVTCRCGSQLVAAGWVDGWTCGTCKQAGTVGERYRLCDVSVADLSKRHGGWEAE